MYIYAIHKTKRSYQSTGAARSGGRQDDLNLAGKMAEASGDEGRRIAASGGEEQRILFINKT